MRPLPLPAHDLAQAADPSDWWNVVDRIATKAALFAPMSEIELYEVTAYLIAITPDLQRSAQRVRQQDDAYRTLP
jgi:hypothetical protein